MSSIVVVKKPGLEPEVHEVEQKEIGSLIKTSLNGGWFQHVTLKVNGQVFDGWMDEEGKLKRLAVNLEVPGDVFVGNLIFTSSNREGQTTGLNPEQLDAALSFARGTATSVDWRG